jgi:acyl-CoA synthetase (AMP-forming)/AMP-acid ligase II
VAEAVVKPAGADSISQCLRQHATLRPATHCFTFLGDSEGETRSLTYFELDARARAVAAALMGCGAAGQRVLLVFSHEADFVGALFGCLYAGAVAVPTSPPTERRFARLEAILRDARPRAVVASQALAERTRAIAERLGEAKAIEWLTVDGLSIHHDPANVARDADADAGSGATPALLQYTSGSTGHSKGVVLSQANILANLECLRLRQGSSPQSVIMGWLPLFHDLGLIAGVFQAVYLGAPAFLMSPAAFARRPIRWLQALTQHRATVTGAPNFAYDMCVERIAPAERRDLDLSALRVAVTSAEKIRPGTLERFAAAFAPCGFSADAFYPCYGLAESTLIVSGGEAGRGVRRLDVGGRTLIGCGSPVPGHEVRIVDPQTGTACEPRLAGEIWIRGPSVAQGYWGWEDETQRTFGARTADGEGPWLRTGDLGLMDAGELFVSDRIKDVVIVRGRNLHPTDIEATVEAAHPLIAANGVAAFALEVDDEEVLAVAAELARPKPGADLAEVVSAVQRAIAESHEVELHALLLVARNRLPRTTSGKLQRHACRTAYVRGEFEPLHAWVRQAPTRRDAGERPEPTVAGLQSWLVERLANVLGVERRLIDPRAPLSSFGLGSRDALALAGDLAQHLGRDLPPTLWLEADSLRALARQLCEPARPGLPGLAADITPAQAQAMLRELERLPAVGIERLVRDNLRTDEQRSPAGSEPGEAV